MSEVLADAFCISFSVMAERAITDALTGDHHFVQAGFRALMIP
jgi:predicted nucleic acid-binding protein